MMARQALDDSSFGSSWCLGVLAVKEAGGSPALRVSVVDDEPEEVEQELGREEGGDAGRVVGRRHLDEVDADDAVARGHALQELEHLVIEEPAMARRAGAGGDRR